MTQLDTESTVLEEMNMRSFWFVTLKKGRCCLRIIKSRFGICSQRKNIMHFAFNVSNGDSFTLI